MVGMVSLDILRMTSDSSDGPNAEDWHTADADGADMIQQLGLQVAVSEGSGSVYVDAVACCDSSTMNNNHTTDSVGTWHSQQIAESHDDSFEHGALNGLLDVPQLLSTNSASLQFGILPAHFGMWASSDFDAPHPSELIVSASHAQSGTLQAVDTKVLLTSGASSKLPNIESLMNLSSNMANVPLTSVAQTASTNEELLSASEATYFENQTQQDLSRNRGRNRKAPRKQTKKVKQEPGVKLEDDLQPRRGGATRGAKRKSAKDAGSSPEPNGSCSSTRRESSTYDEYLTPEDDGEDAASGSESLSLPNVSLSNDGTQHTDGSLQLTNEECILLEKEGVRLPLAAPLSKEQERVLKRVRRKIRNKISAKNSRLKKQEYVDGLERRVRSSTSENAALQRRVRQLEKTNESLLNEISQLRNVVLAQQRAAAASAPAPCANAYAPGANATVFTAQNDASRPKTGRVQPAACRITRSLASAVSSSTPSSASEVQSSALPPISTLSPTPKGKMLLVVVFSFAFVFLPIVGVQLRRPALLNAASKPSLVANPFYGASRVLLTADDSYVDANFDDSIDFHQQVHEATRNIDLDPDDDDDYELQARRMGNVVEKSALDEALELDVLVGNLKLDSTESEHLADQSEDEARESQSDGTTSSEDESANDIESEQATLYRRKRHEF